MTQAQRSYHAFVRAVKATHGVSHKEAQQAYRAVRDRLGHTPRAKDVKGHPRIVKQEATRARAVLEGKRGAREAATRRAVERSKKPAEKVTPKSQKKREREFFDDGDYETFEDPLEAEY